MSAMRTSLAFVVLASSCTFGSPAPTPVPVRGDMPHTIAVWPVVDDGHTPRDTLLAGLDAALRQRGHHILTWQVAQELLRGTEVSSPQAAPAAAARALGADGAMQFVVREFTAAGSRPLREAHWDLEWRLVSLRSGTVLWSTTHRGGWVPPRDAADPNRPLDAEPDVVPIGGRAPFVYLDAAELLAALHQQAMAFLPPRSR